MSHMTGGQAVVAALRIRGTLHAQRHDYLAARLDFERAMQLKRRVVGEGHPQFAETQTELAAVLAKLDDPSALATALHAEGVARAVHSGVVWCFVGIQALEYLYTPTVLALFHNQNVLR